MKLLRCVAVALVLSGLSSLAVAEDAVAWLQRMSQAARNLNYSGVFVYQSGKRSELSRITHFVDANGEHERLEALDGPPREVLRNNDEVQCFFPADKVMVLERASKDRFPGTLSGKASVLGDYYNVRLGPVVRVAGRDAQMVILEPRDDMRYGHQFWADLTTGLLLKARMVDDAGQVVEQFSFSEIAQGIPFDHERIKVHANAGADWQVLDARGNELRPGDLAWLMRSLPIGYRMVSLTRRLLRKDGPDTLHLMFSDGLANVSVFIEPIPPGAKLGDVGSAKVGSTSIYRKVVNEHLITVLGEVPAAAIRRVADGVETKKK
ncbi:MucB/RseB C-terminal domain-containing protein [Uliginosibacterium gangwonense]|uniref:MucB/RseB C-terminal domain-containing protein n=1 Tax=Uliginosibacterium gangwonense TaxID=392736 RepID=UPI0004768D5D|nr:MucB/RseB C-terminal domain-containing protein [Uliginosibacterium gangwonense]